MVRNNHFTYRLRNGAITMGGLSTVLGLVVLAGWYSHTEVLIQVLPAFVPMQYNTATGFLFGGVGLMAIVLSYPRVAVACGALVAAVGILTLVEYIFGVELGIDQLMMKHYIMVKTSHPGRMAPNTALCFSLTGIALLVFERFVHHRRAMLITGMLGALVLGLGVVAFSGYMTGLETAYGWGHLTRMAVHTAFGFMVLGIGIFILAWNMEQAKVSGFPYWLPHIIGIGVLFVATVLWQALHAQEMEILRQFPQIKNIADETILVFGVILAIAISMAVHLAQVSRQKEVLADEARHEAENEVAERKQVEKRLHIAKAEADVANESKSRFLANISHDLRTPLNAIIGFSELMKSETFGPHSDPHYEEYSTDIYDSGQFLLNLINDILDLSKAEAGKFELLERAMDLGARIQATAKLISSQAEQAKVTLTVNVAQDLPPFFGDERAITQILNNLLSNAIKFTGENGNVSVSANTNELGGVDIRVSDNGVGMSRDGIAQAMQPFTQTNSNISRNREGTGLGLPLCETFVELHGGTLIVESDVGKGTTVIARFPAERLAAV